MSGTCFWRGLIKSLNKHIFNYKLRQPKPKELIHVLKMKAIPTRDVLWQGEALSEPLLKENLRWIKEYDAREISLGHWTSTCDPFLLLVCQLYGVHIEHDYTGIGKNRRRTKNLIKYTYKPNPNAHTLKFWSNTGHFEPNN